MAEIKNINGRQVIDYMARDFASFREAMIRRIDEVLPDWNDRSEADFGIALIELFAHLADILSYYQDRVVNESFLHTAQERRSVIQHLRLIGYELAPAAPASTELKLTFTVDNSRNDTIRIQPGHQFSTTSTPERPSVVFEYIGPEDLIIELNKLEPDSGGTGKKRFESGQRLADDSIAPFIPVQEGRTIKDELLGTSDERANQRFTLARPKLIRDSLQLFVGSGGSPWQRRDSLVFSRATDPAYMLRMDENEMATIYFGDGIYGKIPPKGYQIRATYRVGGGRHGNVPANTITTILESPDLVNLGARVTNPEPARGGEERETIDHAIRFAPLVFKSNQRAVTVEDFVALAKQFPGVGKARAEAANWNLIHLYIAPTGGGPVSDVMKSDLLAYFEDKRMMTTRIEIRDAEYVPIYITARVSAKPFAFKAEVEAGVQEAIKSLLDFDVVSFGHTLFLSKIYEAVEALSGVDSVFVSQFRPFEATTITDERNPAYDADVAIASGGRIALGANQIPIPGYKQFVDVTVEGGL